MGINPISDGQLRYIRKIACDKRVDQETFQQKAVMEGKLAVFMDSLVRPQRNVWTPPYHRIHKVRVKVEHNRRWRSYADAVGQEINERYNLWQGEDAYPPLHNETVIEDILLINDRRGMGWSDAVKWARRERLVCTVPCQVFAIREQYPNLPSALDLEEMSIIATTERADGRGYHDQTYGVGWFKSSAVKMFQSITDRAVGQQRDWYAFMQP